MPVPAALPPERWRLTRPVAAKVLCTVKFQCLHNPTQYIQV
jgi:hypothetical protein